MPSLRYDTPEKNVELYRTVEERLSNLPGVERVATVIGSPMGRTTLMAGVELRDRPEPPPGKEVVVLNRVVTPGYLDVLDIALVTGRFFDERDRHGSVPVAVITRRMAEEHYPGEDPIGKPILMGISLGYEEEEPRTVIGVVDDIRSRGLTTAAQPEIYTPFAQSGASFGTVLVRGSLAASSLLPAIRAAVREIDADLPLRRVETLEEVHDRAFAGTRFYLLLLGAFAALAVVLAAVGLYGVVAYAVSQRTREISIRMALGARSNDVVRRMLVQGVLPSTLGVFLGLLGAGFASRFLDSLLYQVEPLDLTTFLGVTVLMLAIVALASFVPALRAARIPPAAVLRV